MAVKAFLMDKRVYTEKAEKRYADFFPENLKAETLGKCLTDTRAMSILIIGMIPRDQLFRNKNKL